MSKKKRPTVSELNPHLLCILCGGYYVDATTVIECLHTFCKSCIVRYLETSKFCPTCDVLVHKTKPLLSIRPDKSLQNAVYKLVPGLLKNEMCRRRKFYSDNTDGKPSSEEDSGNHLNSGYLLPSDSLSIALKPIPPVSKDQTENNFLHTRFFNCPAGVSISLLKRLLRAKFDLPEHHPVLISSSKDDILQDDFTLIDVAYIKSWEKDCPLVMYYKIYFNKRLKVDPVLEQNLEEEVSLEERRMPKLEPELETCCSSESEERTLPKLSPISDVASCASTLPEHAHIVSAPSSVAETITIKAEAKDTVGLGTAASKSSSPVSTPTYKAIIPAPFRPPPIPEMVSLNSVAIPSVDPLAARNCSPGAYSYGFGLLASPGSNMSNLFPGGVVNPTKIGGTVLPFGLTLGPGLICASPTPVNNFNVNFPGNSNISSLTRLTPQPLWGQTESNPSNVILPIANLDTSVVHSVPSEPISSIIKSDSTHTCSPITPPVNGGKKPKLIRPKKNSSDKTLPPHLPPPPAFLPTLPSLSLVPPAIEEKEVQLMISESGVMIVNEGDRSSNHLQGLINPVYSEANELLTKIESGSLLSLSDPYSEDSKESDTSDGAEKLAQIKQEITSILSTLSSDDPQKSVVVTQTEAVVIPVSIHSSLPAQQLTSLENPQNLSLLTPEKGTDKTENECVKVFPLQLTSSIKENLGKEKISISNSSLQNTIKNKDSVTSENGLKNTFNVPLQSEVKSKLMAEKSKPKNGVSETPSITSSVKISDSDKVANRKASSSSKDHSLVKRSARRHSQSIGYKTLKISPRGWNPTISRDKLQKKLNYAPKTNKFFKARNSVVSSAASTIVTNANLCTNVKQNESHVSLVPVVSSITKEFTKLPNHVALNINESQHPHKVSAEEGEKGILENEANSNKLYSTVVSNLSIPCKAKKRENAPLKGVVSEESLEERLSKNCMLSNSESNVKEKMAPISPSASIMALKVVSYPESSEVSSNRTGKKEEQRIGIQNVNLFSSDDLQKSSKRLKDKEVNQSLKEHENLTKSSSDSALVNCWKHGNKHVSLTSVTEHLSSSAATINSSPSASVSTCTSTIPLQSTFTQSNDLPILSSSSPKKNNITFPSHVVSGIPLTPFPETVISSKLTSTMSSVGIPKEHFPQYSNPSTSAKELVEDIKITSTRTNAKTVSLINVSEISSQFGKIEQRQNLEKKAVINKENVTSASSEVSTLRELEKEKDKIKLSQMSVKANLHSSAKETPKASQNFHVPKVSSDTLKPLKNVGLLYKEKSKDISINKPNNFQAVQDALILKPRSVSKLLTESTIDAKEIHPQQNSVNSVMKNSQICSSAKSLATNLSKEAQIQKESSHSLELKSQINPTSHETKDTGALDTLSTLSRSSEVKVSANSENCILPTSQKAKPLQIFLSSDHTYSPPFSDDSSKLKQSSIVFSKKEKDNSITLSLASTTLTFNSVITTSITTNTVTVSREGKGSNLNDSSLNAEAPGSHVTLATDTASSASKNIRNVTKRSQPESTPTEAGQNVSSHQSQSISSTADKNGSSLNQSKLTQNETAPASNKGMPANVQLHYTMASALNSVFPSPSSSFNLEPEALLFAEKNSSSFPIGAIASPNSLVCLPTSYNSCTISSTHTTTALNFESPLTVAPLPYSDVGTGTKNFSSGSHDQLKEGDTLKISTSFSHNSLVNTSETSERPLESSATANSSSSKTVAVSLTRGISLTSSSPSSQNHSHNTSASQCHKQLTAAHFNSACSHSAILPSVNLSDSNSKSNSLSKCSFSFSDAMNHGTSISNSKPSNEAAVSSQNFDVSEGSRQVVAQNTLLENSQSSYQHNNLSSFPCGEGFYLGSSLQNSSMPFVNNFMPFASSSLTQTNIPTTSYINSPNSMNNTSTYNIHHHLQTKSKSQSSDNCRVSAIPNTDAASSSTLSDCSQSLSTSFSSLTGTPTLQDASKFIQNLLGPTSLANQEHQKSNLKSSVEELDKLLLQTISSTVPESKITELFPSPLVDCSENMKGDKQGKVSPHVSTSLEIKHNAPSTSSISSESKTTYSFNSSQVNTILSQAGRSTAQKNSHISRDETSRLNSTNRDAHSHRSENTFQNVLNGSSSQFQTTVSNDLSKSSTHLVSLQTGPVITSSIGSQNTHFKSGYHHQTQCCKHQNEPSNQLDSTKNQSNHGLHQQMKLNEQHVNTSTSLVKKNSDLVDKTALSTPNANGSYSEGSNYNSVSSSNSVVDSNMTKKVQRSTCYLGSSLNNQSSHQFTSLSLNSMMNTFHEGVPSTNLSAVHKHSTQGATWDTNPLTPFIFNNNGDAYGATVNKSGFSPNTSSNCIQQNLFRSNSNVIVGKDSNMNTHSQTNFNMTANVPCSPKNSSILNHQYGSDNSTKKGASNVDSYENFHVGSQKYNASLYYSNYNSNYANFFSNSQSQGSPSLTSLVSGASYNFPLSNSKFTSCQQYLNLGQNSANNSYFPAGNFNVNGGSNYQSCINQPPTSNVCGSNMSSNFGNNFSGPLCNISLPYYSNCSFSYNSYPYFYQGSDMSLLSPTASFMPPFSCLPPRSSLSSRNSSPSQPFNDFSLQSGLFPMMPFVSPLQGNGARAPPSPVASGIGTSFSGRPFSTNYPQKSSETATKVAHKNPQASPKAGSSNGGTSLSKSKHRKTSSGNKHKSSPIKDSESKTSATSGISPLTAPPFPPPIANATPNLNRPQAHPVGCGDTASGSVAIPVQTDIINRTSAAQLDGKTKAKLNSSRGN